MIIILVHGLWSAAAHWRGVIESLKSLGVTDVVTVELPLESVNGDAQVVREAIRKAGGNVVLAGQGYAGMVITEAGTEDAVKGLVYICALVPNSGESSTTVLASHPSDLAPDLEVVDGKLRIKDDKFKDDYCHDLSDEAVQWLRETGRNPSPSVMGEAVTNAAWKDKQSFYIVAEGDKCVTHANQDRMADAIGAVRIASVDGASHAMAVSHPGEVGLFVAGAARVCGA
ncbi:hypothetical protein CcaverHIS002_0200450 [Cutaneotrichosporon cavernicola]|uniref:AB hydrolase-1 domain-containing protein n=1 Tax=Cutaneotrichosporon cavernicola TaxID=279322 RepID=A0AA48L1C7_9TREE|nr:uncharacterized protein CcaverHIS019_0200490 [Cutaneotrichosporon cavernicola]BEI80885.1 hypothetical protein CcaverHIS002_0200450 [Cutaneotrichosporon cavernicola]BEI88687.1 hypothetical protein CcaverHIS019_0200490 [Cutaneotrichosporon cavernicola]BEI96461.1 hypothetical protein CcaverHIS631_0200500 [Cutaneotrichosporon cavernicola]BEJ04233.1 hypothetical protein CcaverHIS641_0200500 [Cutaneotrichosporon cavernicola]